MHLFFILLLSLFSTAKTTYTCASPIDFDRENLDIKQSYSKVLTQLNANGDFLHRIIFDHSKSLFVGGFGEVKEYNMGGKNFVIKKIVPKNKRHVTMMEKEIELLKVICELEPKVVYNKLEQCKSRAIAGFYGCVEDGMILYIFQEKMNTDIQKEGIIKTYSNLRGQQKADIMLQMISKFEEIHQKKIIHSDIKPSNIMIKENDFSDIRIIDFGMSDYLGKYIKGGTPYFISPELTKKKSKLSVEGDIYSLAATFAMMENSTYIFLSTKMDKVCLDPTRKPSDDCVTNYRKGIIASFNSANETSRLANVMKQALNLDPSKRFKSMTLFKTAIINVYYTLPSVNSPRNQNSGGFFGCIKRLLRIGNRIRRRILSSNSKNELSTVFTNPILTEREFYGSKMTI